MSGIVGGVGSKSGVIGPAFGRQDAPWGFYWLRTGQTLTTGTDTIVNWDGGPSETNAWINNSSGTFTVNVPGIWRWHSRIRFNANFGDSQYTVKFNGNLGESYSGSNYDYMDDITKYEQMSVELVARMNTTDTVNFWAYQSSGSNKLIDGNTSVAHIVTAIMIG
ncbi:uncharacterized protein METZ01_LOCUS287699 [marine metagenome]|uniref:C1q domain-containing protein n=1 Tax=marine metagenome TaxID=408172 RepID=A0A382LG52_9ZZZZ